MLQRRSNIPMLGIIFFSVIIIGSAINGKPGMLMSIIATAVILFIISLLRKKVLGASEIDHHTDEEKIYRKAQQQSLIQLWSIIIPISLICGAISGNIIVLITLIISNMAVLTIFMMRKRSQEHKETFFQEIKILFRSTVFGIIIAAMILLFGLATGY